MYAQHMGIELFKRARQEPLYLTCGLDYVRTEPTPDGEHPYSGFIKTTIGEKQIAMNAKPIHEALLCGSEITKEEYDAYSFACQHSWRTAWLKNSNATRKVTFCTVCGHLMKDN